MADIYLTKKGKVENEARLEYLIGVSRKEVAEKIKAAREFGDLSENAEYDAARDEQARIESEIIMIEKTLRLAKIVDEKKVSKNVVSVGCKVKVLNKEYGDESNYSIVGSLEADPKAGLISNQSPIGGAILGKKVGDEVSVSTPAGIMTLKILEIK